MPADLDASRLPSRDLLITAAVVLCGFPYGAASSASAQSAQPPPPAAQIDLEQTLHRIRAEYDLPAVAAAVVRGQSIQAAAVGVRRVGAPDVIRITDRFHIASCTKSMTAMLAAILVEQGRLRWTSRLVDVIPELQGRVRSEYRHATLEQLLGHGAHMPAYTQFGPRRLEELKALRGTATEQRLAFLTEVLSAEPPNRASGDAAYSNVGYTAAALMMERAAGESWEELMRMHLFRPLGLTHVGFGWPATKVTPREPRGHVRRGGRSTAQPLDDSYMLPVALWPAGAVNSSIGDLARYAADHLRGLRGETALLPRSAYEKLHRTLSGEPEGFTLGWGVRQDPRWGTAHYGAGSGGTFFVRILIVPDRDIAIVVASNSGDAAAATRSVVDALLATASDKRGSIR
jgi:CubicO group peptidase (beta-lactamase class C family)